MEKMVEGNAAEADEDRIMSGLLVVGTSPGASDGDNCQSFLPAGTLASE